MKKFNLKIGDMECPRCQGRAEVCAKGRVYAKGLVMGVRTEEHGLCYFSRTLSPIPREDADRIKIIVGWKPKEAPREFITPRDPSEPQNQKE